MNKKPDKIPKKQNGGNVIIITNKPLGVYLDQIVFLGSVKRYNEIVLRALFRYAGTLDILVERLKFFGLEEAEEKKVVKDTNINTGEALQVVEVILEKIPILRI